LAIEIRPTIRVLSAVETQPRNWAGLYRPITTTTLRWKCAIRVTHKSKITLCSFKGSFGGVMRVEG
jgi:hypothetical protein